MMHIFLHQPRSHNFHLLHHDCNTILIVIISTLRAGTNTASSDLPSQAIINSTIYLITMTIYPESSTKNLNQPPSLIASYGPSSTPPLTTITPQHLPTLTYINHHPSPLVVTCYRPSLFVNS